jgi:transposase
VWAPDEFTRGLRRRLQRRSKLVRSRTRAKNQCHAVLARNLKGRPPVTDVFGKKGRQWLAALELPADESETLECCLREVDFLDSEVGLIERELARQAMTSQRDPPTDDRPRDEPGLGRCLRGRRWRHPPLQLAEEARLLCRP